MPFVALLLKNKKRMKNLFWLFLLLISMRVEAVSDSFYWVEAGNYSIGSKESLDNPARKVEVKGFYISKYEITNADFAVFVAATDYITVAERAKNAMVFEPGLEEFRWLQDSTAYWRFPNGVTRGGIKEKMNHPVTCISYKDAMAYCAWAKVRLPTIEEWEVAAKAGTAAKYFEGVQLENVGDYGNIWHLKNHLEADLSDGFMYTAPVGSFLPNPWGLYDIFGNVFEFCEGQLDRDKGRKVAHARGGSWWCSKHSCAAFNTVYIGSVNPNASFSNLGFRVVKEQ